jgi:hypothetical protein
MDLILNEINNIIKSIWVNDIKLDYDNGHLLKEDTLKNSLYFHLRTKLSNILEENDLRRTELLNSVGGKLRATQLDALLRQWSMYEEMLEQYESGNGSMQREAEKTANSWEGVSKKAANTWQDTVGNIANSDFIIGALNSLNELLELLNKLTDSLGSLGTISLGAGLFAGVKNFGKTYKCMVSNRNCFEYALHA